MEFAENSSKIAVDEYTSTYGTVIGEPQWQDVRTSGRGVLTFNGKDQYIIADSSYAMLHDAEYQTAVLLRDSSKNSIFSFGSDENAISLTAENGSFILSVGGQQITAENAYAPGEWVVVSASFIGDTASITINGNTVASGTVTIDPVDVVSEDAKYLIADDMNGSMDFFTVNFKDINEPEYYYTEKEDIVTVPVTIKGDINMDGKCDIADLVQLQKWLIAVPDTHLANWKAGDLCEDDRLNVFDLCLMKRELLKQKD